MLLWLRNWVLLMLLSILWYFTCVGCGFGVLCSSFGKVTSLVFKWDDNLVIKHDSDAFLSLYYASNDYLVFWYCFGDVCAWTDSKPCKSRPRGSISPKRDLQSLTLSPGSWFSPRRPRKGLSDMVSRSGEKHSPKWGQEENLRVWARYLAQARGFEF